MAKKSFAAGVTKAGILNNDGGNKLKELQAKTEYNFQFIDKSKIKSNPKNEKYNQDGIEALMESILINGLRHNLSVIFDADTDTYRLVSGERRYRAICMMSDKQYNTHFPSGIPCKIEKSNITDIDEEIMLISANHDVRETSMEVKRWEISRLMELYEAKKLKGEIKNIHAEIAKQLNISERQARKYTTAEKLIPELSELLNNNGIDLNQADKFGRLDEDAQRSILDIINKNGNINNEEYQAVKALSEEKAKEATEYKNQLDEANKLIDEKESVVKALEKRITQLEAEKASNNTFNENINVINESNNKIEDELKIITEAKLKAEKEKEKLENDLEKLKQQQKEKEKRKTDLSDSELKRINLIAKTEQALNLLENNFDVLKNNKSLIKTDIDLKIRVEILRDRLNDLLKGIE